MPFVQENFFELGQTFLRVARLGVNIPPRIAHCQKERDLRRVRVIGKVFREFAQAVLGRLPLVKLIVLLLNTRPDLAWIGRPIEDQTDDVERRHDQRGEAQRDHDS